MTFDGCRPTTARLPLAAIVVAWSVLGAVACTPSAVNPCDSDPPPCETGLTCVTTGDTFACVPPADPCGAQSNPCSASEICSVGPNGLARCTAVDLCLGVRCAVGKRCDPTTGDCSITVPPCEGVRCDDGFACNPATNLCEAVENKCAGVCCETDEVCDPARGVCVPDLCEDPQFACVCGPSEVCEPVTGECRQLPGRCPACGENEYCDEGRGRCVEVPRGAPANGRVGAACTDSNQCALSGSEPFCIQDEGLFGAMPGGMCSANCDKVGCPDGTGCFDLGLFLCLDLCLEDADCRNGYECQQVTSDDTRKVCFPRGGGGSTCTGADCNPIGGECRETNDCVRGSTCLRSWPNGYCYKEVCNLRTDCPSTSDCFCLRTSTCATAGQSFEKCDVAAADCRPGYTCLRVTAAGEGVCFPRSCEDDQDCRVDGDSCSQLTCDVSTGTCTDPCTSSDQCEPGQACNTETGRCYRPCRNSTDNCGPDGLCNTATRTCERKCGSDANCEAGEFCDNSSGRCLPRCSGDIDCSGGQVCDSQGRCRAPCGDDGDCGLNQYCAAGRCLQKCTAGSGCAFGERCDGSSGQCQRDLSQTLVGRTCVRDSDCGLYHATCLTGPEYPGGYCTAEDCSATEPCGETSNCVAHGGGASRCLLRCNVGVQGACRPGYECVPTVAGGLTGSCAPAN